MAMIHVITRETPRPARIGVPSPRVLLAEALARHRDPEAAAKAFYRAIRNDPIAVEMVILDWARTAASRSLGAQQTKRLPTPASADAAKRIKGMLLRVVMPSGKTLKNTLGRELPATSEWLRRLAELVPPNRRVGDVLDEQQVRDVYAASAAAS